MSTYAQATGKSIKNAFREFDEANPHIYEAFKTLTFKAIRAGKTKLGAKQIIGVVRWEYDLLTNEKGLIEIDGEMKKFKCGDQYTAHYARKFREEFPEHADKFNFRRLRSARDKQDLFDVAGI